MVVAGRKEVFGGQVAPELGSYYHPSDLKMCESENYDHTTKKLKNEEHITIIIPYHYHSRSMGKSEENSLNCFGVALAQESQDIQRCFNLQRNTHVFGVVSLFSMANHAPKYFTLGDF